jgi:beta-glucosidase-like glycosyl hydrolase
VFRASCATPCQRLPPPHPPPPPPSLLSCWGSPSISTQKYCDPRLSVNERLADLLPRLTQDEKINRLQWQGHSPAIERLGIPAMWHQECQHGLWNGAGAGGDDPTGCMPNHPANSTGCPSSFPVLVALGATFNKSAVRLVATAISDEGRVMNNFANGSDGKSKALGALTCWSPNTNLVSSTR